LRDREIFLFVKQKFVWEIGQREMERTEREKGQREREGEGKGERK
jgi:hypothetical protein